MQTTDGASVGERTKGRGVGDWTNRQNWGEGPPLMGKDSG